MRRPSNEAHTVPVIHLVQSTGISTHQTQELWMNGVQGPSQCSVNLGPDEVSGCCQHIPPRRTQNENPPAVLEAFIPCHELVPLTQLLIDFLFDFPFLLKANLHQNEVLQ